MAFLTRNLDYQSDHLLHTFQFNRGVKVVLFLLLLPLLVYYTLLVCASVIIIYAIHDSFIKNQKMISLFLFVLWSLAGLVTSLAGLATLVNFRWSSIITGLIAILATLALECALTIYGN